MAASTTAPTVVAPDDADPTPEARLGGRSEKPTWRGWIHRGACFVFPALGLLVVLDAPTATYRWPAMVFVAGMTGVFLVSSTFHLGSWTGRRYTLMRRLDHSMNSVALAAGYTPYLAFCFFGSARITLLIGYWALTAVVVASRVVWINAPPKVAAASYLALGWIGVVLLPFIAGRISHLDLALVFLGAGCITVGAVIYATERPDPFPSTFGFHEVFHALALAGQLVLLLAVWQLFP